SGSVESSANDKGPFTAPINLFDDPVDHLCVSKWARGRFRNGKGVRYLVPLPPFASRSVGPSTTGPAGKGGKRGVNPEIWGKGVGINPWLGPHEGGAREGRRSMSSFKGPYHAPSLYKTTALSSSFCTMTHVPGSPWALLSCTLDQAFGFPRIHRGS